MGGEGRWWRGGETVGGETALASRRREGRGGMETRNRVTESCQLTKTRLPAPTMICVPSGLKHTVWILRRRARGRWWGGGG